MFLFFMNRRNTAFQISCRCRTKITNCTFKGFFSAWSLATWMSKYIFVVKLVTQKSYLMVFMNRRNMFEFPFVVKLLSKTSHFDVFFPSWTEETCLFKAAAFEKPKLQISHLEGYFPSWTIAMWMSIHLFIVKFLSQTSHFKAFLHVVITYIHEPLT